jgi:hypothetical protein
MPLHLMQGKILRKIRIRTISDCLQANYGIGSRISATIVEEVAGAGFEPAIRQPPDYEPDENVKLFIPKDWFGSEAKT